MKNKILIVGTEGLGTRILLNAVDKHWDVVGFILEYKIQNSSILKGRIKKVGLPKALGQAIFVALIQPLIGGKNRATSLYKEHGLKVDDRNQIQILSVNDEALILQVQKLNPDYILLSGCRIISKETLQKIKVPILNIHAGITPKYRGVHGGYWALRNSDNEHFGVSLHLVDQGIDTGDVIDQKVLQVSKEDNFNTYPMLQLLGGIQLLEDAQTELWKGNIPSSKAITEDSKMYYHPTWWQYLSKRWGKGIK